MAGLGNNNSTDTGMDTILGIGVTTSLGLFILLVAGISGNKSTGTGTDTTLGSGVTTALGLIYSFGGRHQQQQQCWPRHQYNIGVTTAPGIIFILLVAGISGNNSYSNGTIIYFVTLRNYGILELGGPAAHQHPPLNPG